MAKEKARRETESEGEEEGDDTEEHGCEEDDEEEKEEDEDEEEEDEEEEEQDEVEGEEQVDASGAQPKKAQGPINMKKLSSFKDKLERTGVVYMSRVPPYMKAQKIRHLLSDYGEIGRIYLTPEDPAIRKKRKAMGGNKKQVWCARGRWDWACGASVAAGFDIWACLQSFVDGWIEFADKRIAKSVAKTLNCQPIGGKATSFWAADLWTLKCVCVRDVCALVCVCARVRQLAAHACLQALSSRALQHSGTCVRVPCLTCMCAGYSTPSRYLSKFKWNHLTEKVAYDNQVPGVGCRV